jgi:hypothetical protein
MEVGTTDRWACTPTEEGWAAPWDQVLVEVWGRLARAEWDLVVWVPGATGGWVEGHRWVGRGPEALGVWDLGLGLRVWVGRPV